MPSKYERVKLSKTRPACANAVLLFDSERHGGFSVWWRGRAKPSAKAARAGAVRPGKPKAKRWANLVVFLHDTRRAKRSFHVAWNGERFNDTPESALLSEREPGLHDDLFAHLGMLNDKLIRQIQRQELADKS